MTENLVYAALESRALVRVNGPEWRGFLQGLLTQDVETLIEGEIRFAAMLTPQGKLLFDLFVVGGAEGCLLDCQAAQRDALMLRLKMYRLRAKAEIAAVDGKVVAAFSPLPLAGRGLGVGVSARSVPAGSEHPHPPAPSPQGGGGDPRLPELGFRLYGAAITPNAPEDAYDAHRLALGVPDPARDCVPDKTYPIEANFDLLHGIDFQKGCFVGQETTSRMKRRGAIKTRMLPIVFEGPPPPFGAEVLAGQLRAGEVLSGHDGRAMALLRLDRIETAELTVDGRPVQVERPAWFG